MTGGLKSILDTIKNSREQKSVKIQGYLDDYLSGENILGKVSEAVKFKHSYFWINIGNVMARTRIGEFLLKNDLSLFSAVHSNAYVAENTEIGEGSIICAGCVIQPGTKIGKNVFINTGVIIEHDNNIGEHCNISSGIVTGGPLKIGKSTFIGLNCTILPYVVIGNNCYIGAGGVITKNIPDNSFGYGVPFRIRKRNKCEICGKKNCYCVDTKLRMEWHE